jgi:hypothetical protein
MRGMWCSCRAADVCFSLQALVVQRSLQCTLLAVRLLLSSLHMYSFGFFNVMMDVRCCCGLVVDCCRAVFLPRYSTYGQTLGHTPGQTADCRYEESLAAYDRLLKFDPNWYQWTSYVNVMAMYPWALLGAKGPQVGNRCCIGF